MYYILWCLLLLLVGPGIIFLLLPRIDIMSCTSIATFKLLNKKTANLVKLFSTPQSPYPHLPWDLYAFCIHLISFLLFDAMSSFTSVFIPSCVKVRINSAVPRFGKQLSILSKSFCRSSISLIGCCFERS